MARPKPKIILENYNKKTHRTLQIVEAVEQYVVLYEGKPFNSKDVMTWANNPTPKYQRTSFVNVGSAHGMARRLNTKFKTNKFGVYRVASYEAIGAVGKEE